MHDIAEEVALLGQVVESGGAIAMGYFQSKTLKTWDKTKGHAVTEADMAVNAHLEAVLKQARPDYGWLSEESPHAKSIRSGKRNFIVDPIDGTSAFIAGRADWCVAVALEEDGVIIAAALYVPVTKYAYRAGLGLGAWRGTGKIHCAPASDLPSRIMSKVVDFDAADLPSKTHIKDRPFSLILRFVMVAEGMAEAVIASGMKADWDIAAGALMVSEAGGKVSTMTGEPLRFNCTQPFQTHVLAATPACYDSLLLTGESAS